MNAGVAKTVLLTGGSSGIGYELARLFARDGYDLLLISRKQEKLEDAASRLRDEFRERKIDTLCIDLARETAAAEVYSHCVKAGRKVDVLVNNAGFTIHGPLIDRTPDEVLALVHGNSVAPLLLSRYFLPEIVARKGKILTIASLYSFVPVVRQSLYAASKAFTSSVMQALAQEVEASGVQVTTVYPGITRSDFRKNAGLPEKDSIFAMDSKTVAEISYAAFLAGKRTVIPGLVNKIFVVMAKVLPAGMRALLMRAINKLRGVS